MRWTLICAFAASAVGMASLTSQPKDAAAQLDAPAPRHVQTAPPSPVVLPELPARTGTDPFAPRGWEPAPAPAPPVPAPVAAPAAVAVAAPPQAPLTPALPFAFMGRLNDGVTAMVYISRGDESWTVKGGEALDGNYKVLTVAPQQIVFEYLPTGTQQTLALPEPDK